MNIYKRFPLLLLVLLLFSGCTNLTVRKGMNVEKIIFDTDFGPDYDDVGALAFLHAMADSGKVEILATVASNSHDLVVPSIEVVNTWFGRPGLALGAPKTPCVIMGSSQHWADSLVAGYAHTIGSTSEAADAVGVYRKILAGQPDKSVTIITVGFLTNLNNLLKSQPDSFSPLNGEELVTKKVKKLVSMAGSFPEGREFNVYLDSTASEYVFNNWPGEIVFTGFEIGAKICTGLRLIESAVRHSPVKDVYRICIPLSEEDRGGRMSWDQTAVLIGVYGTEKFFDVVRGRMIPHPDGSNHWENNPAGPHSYVVQKMPVGEMSRFIEDRMMHAPVVKQNEYRTIGPEVLKDKIAGGWAGKMLGVSYGAPTEFRAQNRIFEDSIKWKPSDSKGSMWQDDIYVQLTFLMTMDRYGIDAPAKKFQEMFAKSGYPVWHANMQARKNYYDSIFAPASGNPDNSMHSDDIDFQIEADYIGFMCPGMPQTASEIAGKIGHIMNYGDGVYGGIFVGALYSEAFFEPDILKVIEKALRSIPAESDYAAIVRDVVKLHGHDPEGWRAAWKELESKWGDVDICGAGAPFNIDAKLNGAYIVLGLLYGDGDPLKTLEITTRCGQDSDCNPSNALAVLGVMRGFSGLPRDWQEGVRAVGDSLFIHTAYSYNSAVSRTNRYALDLIARNGGMISDKQISVKTQTPVTSKLEVSYPDVVFDKSMSVFDEQGWKFRGNWKPYEISSGSGQLKKQSMYSETAGDELVIDFSGTGISLEGNWYKDGGKADIYVDGNLHRSIDTYYFFANQQHTTSIWHVLNLKPGVHQVRLVVTGEKRPESGGTRVYISKATVFRRSKKL